MLGTDDTKSSTLKDFKIDNDDDDCGVINQNAFMVRVGVSDGIRCFVIAKLNNYAAKLSPGMWNCVGKKTSTWGSGCGSVGRPVAYDTRGPRFESSHQQNFIDIEYLLTVNCVLKRRK